MMMKRIHLVVVAGALAVCGLLFPGGLTAKPVKRPQPIVVQIDAAAHGGPRITVKGDPNGYDVTTPPGIVDPAIEEGGLITLFGVDQFGPINPGDNGWRFINPCLPADAYRNATDIVWIQHDWYVTGNLQVAFDSRTDGGYYVNPEYTNDASAGPATNRWVTVYADDTIVVEYRAGAPGCKR
jgi:hypothetical protein